MARPRIAELDRQLQSLQAESDRARRALGALHNLSIPSRGATTFRHIFAATERELGQVFSFDACYIAVCDTDQPGMFRAVLMVDEGVAEYTEGDEFGALTGLVIGEGRPLVFRDLDERRAALVESPQGFGSQKHSRSWLGVPLLVGSAAIGVISLQSYQPAVYDEADVDLLQRLGDVVAVMLENTWLDEQQRALSDALADQVSARTAELATLSTIAAELVLQQPLPVLLRRAIALILPLFGLDAATVRLFDPRADTLELLAQRGFPPEYEQEAAVISTEGTDPGLIVRENRPVTVEHDLYMSALAHVAQHLPFTALLGVPLRIGSRVLGALSLLGREPQQFSPQAVDLAQAIGNQIAIAIENARLFDAQARQIGELRALGEISRAASTTLDLPTLLRLVHDEVRQFMRLDAFSMVVYDRHRGVVTDGVSIDEGREYRYWHNQPPPADSLTAWVIRHRRRLHLRNVAAEIGAYNDIRLYQIGAERQAASWLGVPLLNREGAVIGAIFIQGYEIGAFDERDESFLESVGGQVALHVQNARLLAQRERQIGELDAIGQIGQLISASYDFEEMLHGVYETLHQVVKPSVFYLLICDPDTRIVTHAIFIEDGKPVALTWVGKPPAPGSITAWVISQREPLLLQDAGAQREELRARGIEPYLLGPETPVRSWIGVPLLAKEGEPIGVLSLQDYSSHCYDYQTIDFLSQLASHVSLGVQKVRLFEERERQIVENARLYAAEQEARRTADTLREVARVLSTSFDPREVLALMLRELNNVIAYDTASIMLLERDVLRTVARRGSGGQSFLREIPLSGQPSGGGQVVASRAPVLIPDVADSTEWLPSPAQATRSWLGVPLLVKDQIIGVLNIDSRQPDSFSSRDVEVAQAFASQAAVALENARLYEESVTRVEQELEIARRIQSNLFPHSLPQIAGVEIAARCLPARETGGDFFDFVSLADGTLGLFVGDASGKSIPGAMLMAIAHSIVRSEARDHQTPELVMREANAWIAQDVPARSFVALCYATLDVPGRKLALANAAQLTPLRRRAGGALEYLEVPGPRLPLGILPDTAYEALNVSLETGDLLVLFTDGIVEAQNHHELFGFERLEALLHAHGDEPPHALIERTLAAISAFTAGTPPHDDMTIVALRLE